MLQKIIFVKNVGRFQNSAAGGDTTLRKHTFIHAANGHGKTTLCAILRSLTTGDADHIVGRKRLGSTSAPEVNLLLAPDNPRFDGATWNATYPHIAIFDGTFVSENVYSGESVDTDQKRALYRVIIGAAGVALAEEEARLSGESRTKTSEISTVDRAIKTHLPAGMTLEKFLDITAIDDVDAKITLQKTAIQTFNEATAIKARPLLKRLELPRVPNNTEAVLSSTLESIPDGAEIRISNHLRAHDFPEGNDWVVEGLKHTDNNCALCNQDVSGVQLIADYRAFFGPDYAALKSQVTTLFMHIEEVFGQAALLQLAVQQEQHLNAIEFWSKYVTFDTPEFPGYNPVITSLVVNLLREVIHKQSALLEPREIGGPTKESLRKYDSLLRECDRFNETVETINKSLLAKKAEVETGNLKSLQDELTRLQAAKARYDSRVAELCAERDVLLQQKQNIEEQKDAIREQLNQYTESVIGSYESRINELLDNFNAGFRIDETKHNYVGGVATSSYRIVINSHAVELGGSNSPARIPSFKNTLSAGDRSTLALAFFIADLERRDTLDSCTVVLDDPFTSQDAFRRKQTVHEIVKLGRKSKQVIVLSHDASFLKQLWDKCDSAHRVSLGIIDHGRQGSKLMALNLEESCRGRTATDVDDLLAYHNDRVGKPLDIYRKMRTVLETYLKTTFPGSFTDQDSWLGDMIGRIRVTGDVHPAYHLYDELNEINESAEYHHGEDLSSNSTETIDSQELAGLVKRTLRIINALQA